MRQHRPTNFSLSRFADCSKECDKLKLSDNALHQSQATVELLIETHGFGWVDGRRVTTMQIYRVGIGGSRWATVRVGALLLWTLVAGSTAAGQQRVTGIVADKSSGQPVSAASVKLEGDASSAERTT